MDYIVISSSSRYFTEITELFKRKRELKENTEETVTLSLSPPPPAAAAVAVVETQTIFVSG